MAEEIKKTHGLDATLIEGSGGIFEVKADGRLIFSKAQTGRFPDDGEIPKLLGAKKKR